MCGINGLLCFDVNKQKSVHKLIQSMNQAIFHRGPDAGAELQVSETTWLGHRRLAVLDTSSAGNQPMKSACGRYTIVFNGEVYNFKALKKSLLSYQFNTGTDTEVILAMFSKYGVHDSVKKLDGMFAFAVHDAAERKILVARDRGGEKPLYYYNAGPWLSISSELSGIMASSEEPLEISKVNAAQFFKYGYFIGESTPFTDVKKLLPGQLMTINEQDGSLQIDNFIQDSVDEIESDSNLSFDAACDLVEEKLQESIAQKLVADVPLGSFLSGGIDSSLVTAMAQEQSSIPLETFTIGFDDPSFDESPYAEQIAKHLGCKSNVLRLNENILLERALDCVDSFSEPFANPSALPTFLLAEYARQRVTVSLSGDGGDELFIGYNRYIQAELISKKLKAIPRSFQIALSFLAEKLSKVSWDRKIDYLYKMLGKKSAVNYNEKLNKFAGLSHCHSAEEIYAFLIQLFDVNPITGKAYERSILNGASFHFDDNYLKAAAEWDIKHYLTEDCFAKSDRMSMAQSLEVRVPLLSNEVLALSKRIPTDVKVRNNKSKAILRALLSKRVPEYLYERPKMGFTVPIKQWVNRDLNEEIRSVLSSENLKEFGLVDEHLVKTLLDENTARAASRVWALFVFHRWLIKYRSKVNVIH